MIYKYKFQFLSNYKSFSKIISIKMNSKIISIKMNSKIISIKMNSKIISIKMNSVLRARNRFRDGANAKTILDCTASRFFLDVCLREC